MLYGRLHLQCIGRCVYRCVLSDLCVARCFVGSNVRCKEWWKWVNGLPYCSCSLSRCGQYRLQNNWACGLGRGNFNTYTLVAFFLLLPDCHKQGHFVPFYACGKNCGGLFSGTHCAAAVPHFHLPHLENLPSHSGSIGSGSMRALEPSHRHRVAFDSRARRAKHPRLSMRSS